ncbi:response regulator [soil metagenome]
MSNVLLIEDDLLMLRLYERVLQFAHFSVVTAGNGKEGLIKVKTQRFDVILLDMMMPEMNGMEVLTRLKNDPATRGIPVIMLTNLAGDEDIAEAMKRGAIKYIVKSEHEPKSIIAVITSVLANAPKQSIV